jgi:hypothetical protein
MKTIEERSASAAARWADAATRLNHATVTVKASGWRFASSRAVLESGRRPISGGGDAPFDDVAVRQRLRLLVGSGVLPHFHSGRLWAGRSRVEHVCTICSLKIVVGEIELEMTSPTGVVIFLHRRCFDFWVSEPVGEHGVQGHWRAS